MTIEVEHEDKKYWIATVVGVFGQLLSLKWEGGHDDFWYDVKNKNCYPLGFLKKQEDFKIEPPNKINLSEKCIVEVTIKYFQNVAAAEDKSKPAILFTYDRIYELFTEGTVVEVSHKHDPEKHWFSRIGNLFSSYF